MTNSTVRADLSGPIIPAPISGTIGIGGHGKRTLGTTWD